MTRSPMQLTPNVQPFDAAYAALLPDDVREASDAHRDALAALQARQATTVAAREQLAAAGNADGAAANFAVQAGKQPPPATAPTAADDLERAERAVVAARGLARDTQNAYLAAVQEHLPALREAVAARREAVRAQAADAVDVVARALREADGLAVLEHELDERAIYGKGALFQPVWPRRRRDPAEDALASVRARLAPPPPPAHAPLRRMRVQSADTPTAA